MKIAIILGRGVEGCGVTRCSIEFEKATPDTKIFATIDKKWARRDTMNFDRDEFIDDMATIDRAGELSNVDDYYDTETINDDTYYIIQIDY